MAVANDSLTMRIPSKLKKDATKIADDLWLSLSNVIQIYLKKFVDDKYIVVWNINVSDENHIDYYKNNDEYVKVNESAHDVMMFLRTQNKK